MSPGDAVERLRELLEAAGFNAEQPSFALYWQVFSKWVCEPVAFFADKVTVTFAFDSNTKTGFVEFCRLFNHRNEDFDFHAVAQFDSDRSDVPKFALKRLRSKSLANRAATMAAAEQLVVFQRAAKYGHWRYKTFKADVPLSLRRNLKYLGVFFLKNMVVTAWVALAIWYLCVLPSIVEAALARVDPELAVLTGLFFAGYVPGFYLSIPLTLAYQQIRRRSRQRGKLDRQTARRPFTWTNPNPSQSPSPWGILSFFALACLPGVAVAASVHGFSAGSPFERIVSYLGYSCALFITACLAFAVIGSLMDRLIVGPVGASVAEKPVEKDGPS